MRRTGQPSAQVAATFRSPWRCGAAPKRAWGELRSPWRPEGRRYASRAMRGFPSEGPVAAQGSMTEEADPYEDCDEQHEAVRSQRRRWCDPWRPGRCDRRRFRNGRRCRGSRGRCDRWSIGRDANSVGVAHRRGAIMDLIRIVRAGDERHVLGTSGRFARLAAADADPEYLGTCRETGLLSPHSIAV